MIKMILIAIIFLRATLWCEDNSGIMLLPGDFPVPDFSQELPLEEEKFLGRTRLKTTTLELESNATVHVPLEIISNVEIKALVVDSHELRVPFDIEFNKAPEKNGLYEVAFSEEEIDIDRDGTKDTFIYSPKKITSKTLTGNEVLIKGDGISKEGTHKKRVYMTVEIKEGI